MKWIKITVVLVCLLTAGFSTAGAGPGNWDDRAVPVDRENGIYCSLDATTIKRTTSLSGTTYVDVWVKYWLNEEAQRRAEMMSDGQPSDVRYEELDNIAVHYLFRIEPATSERRPLKMELERRYEGLAGQVLHSDDFRVPTVHSKWYSLDAMEQKILLRLLTEPNFYGHLSVDPRLEEYLSDSGRDDRVLAAIFTGQFLWTRSKEDGFFGIPWGTPLEAANKILPTGSLNLEEYQVVYTDAGIGFSDDVVKSRTPALMVFTKDKGLVMVTWQFDATQQSLVEAKLREALGEPVNRAGTMTWKTGHNTRCILDFDRNGEVGMATIMAESFWKTDEILSRYL